MLDANKEENIANENYDLKNTCNNSDPNFPKDPQKSKSTSHNLFHKNNLSAINSKNHSANPKCGKRFHRLVFATNLSIFLLIISLFF